MKILVDNAEHISDIMERLIDNLANDNLDVIKKYENPNSNDLSGLNVLNNSERNDYGPL